MRSLLLAATMFAARMSVGIADPIESGRGDDAHIIAACPAEGNAVHDEVRARNVLKRRMAVPAPGDLDSKVTLRAMIAPGGDTNRWSSQKAVTIEGYVTSVMVGGVSSANCLIQSARYRDTQIELSLDPENKDPSKDVIVAVTPQWRLEAAAHDIDWSTDALQHLILGHWIKVTGWLLFNGEHAAEAVNTAKPGAHVWRATAWELHPVIAIELLPGKSSP